MLFSGEFSIKTCVELVDFVKAWASVSVLNINV